MRPSTDRRGLGSVLIGAFVLAAGSQAYKQVVVNSQIIARARETNRFVVTRTEFAQRGSIYSSDGKVLAQSNDCFELSINYKKVPKSRAFFMAMSEASGIPAIEMLVPAESGGKSRTWKQPMSGSRADKIKLVKGEWRADGISLRRVPRREYPLSDVAEAIVGTSQEGQPITGLESSQNALLAGSPGSLTGMVDRTGAFLPMRMEGVASKAIDGSDLTLTLDSGLQTAAAAAIRKAVEANNADQGVAIAVDPATGDVLAAASWRPDKQANGFNPIVMGRFEPGSTFKILTLAKALDDGVVSAHDTVSCGGVIRVAGKDIKCSHGAHGTVDGLKAIAESCNISAVTWARKIGRDRFIDFMRTAGLFDSTNIGLPGEIPGKYNPDDGSPTLQIANMGFGQALNLAPLSLVSAYAALANEGIRINPRLIKRVGDRETAPPKQVRIVSGDTAAQMMHMMEATIERDFGTGHRLRIPGYRLGGKTGTAQKLGKGWDKERPKYVANFVGYVPIDQPRAVILVMVDNPKSGDYYGGSVAGPVFKEIAQSVIKRFNIPKSE